VGPTFFGGKTHSAPAAIVTLEGFRVPPGVVASLGGGTKAGVANTGFAISKSPRGPKIGSKNQRIGHIKINIPGTFE
jgi:hypothetical protein